MILWGSDEYSFRVKVPKSDHPILILPGTLNQAQYLWSLRVDEHSLMVVRGSSVSFAVLIGFVNIQIAGIGIQEYGLINITIFELLVVNEITQLLSVLQCILRLNRDGEFFHTVGHPWALRISVRCEGSCVITKMNLISIWRKYIFGSRRTTWDKWWLEGQMAAYGTKDQITEAPVHSFNHD